MQSPNPQPQQAQNLMQMMGGQTTPTNDVYIQYLMQGNANMTFQQWQESQQKKPEQVADEGVMTTTERAAYKQATGYDIEDDSPPAVSAKSKYKPSPNTTEGGYKHQDTSQQDEELRRLLIKQAADRAKILGQ